MNNQIVINELLKQINRTLSPTKQARFEFLIARRDKGIITDEEFKELLKITEEIEKNDTLRLMRIAKLADLTSMSLPEIVDFYNL